MLRERHRVRNGFIAAIIALVVISIPLAIGGVQRAGEWIRATTGAPVVRDWIGGRNLTVEAWSVEGDTVSLVLAGPDAPGDTSQLASELAAAFSGPVTVEVEYVASVRERVDAAP
jgi:hypothetical protein